MPSTRHVAFDDPHDFMSSIRAVEARVIPTAKGNFHAELRQITMQRLWMQQVSESLPRIAHAAVIPERVGIDFPLMDQPSMWANGMEVSLGQIVVNGGDATHRRTVGASEWATMSLAKPDFAAAGKDHLGHELRIPSASKVLRPIAVRMSRLLRLHRISGRMARLAPSRLAHPEVAKALENSLIHALVGCLSENTPMESTLAQRHHTKIITKFEEHVMSRQGAPLYLADLCRATGVSERTLRICCNERFGMGPIRYLWLRRMNQARRALQLTDSMDRTVTDIATEYGFWELGRFSVEYRRLFGEGPSVTLKRPAERLRSSEGILSDPGRYNTEQTLSSTP